MRALEFTVGRLNRNGHLELKIPSWDSKSLAGSNRSP
jgi:hypothetical protein